MIQENKHDEDCRRRKSKYDSPYLCTCGLTDTEVEPWMPKKPVPDLMAALKISLNAAREDNR